MSARRAARSADVREGSPWTRGQALKNDAIYILIRAALAVLVPLPAFLLRAIGRILGATALVLFPGARRVALANVGVALPALSPRARRALVRRAYVTLGAHLGDAAAALDPRTALAALPMDDDAHAVLGGALAEGRGVLFASAHLGPWERVAASLVAAGYPLTTLARESYDPRLNDLYDRLRGARGVRVIYRGHAAAPGRIVRTLRANGLLGAPMDLRSRVPSIDAPLFGRLAPTAIGPARIALRTGAAVVVGTAAPAGGASLTVTATRIPTADLPTGPAGERALTERINAELSARILALPEHWVWMHARFDRDA